MSRHRPLCVIPSTARITEAENRLNCVTTATREGRSVSVVDTDTNGPRPTYQRASQVAVYVRVWPRSRFGDAGTGHRRPERGRVQGPRCRDLRGDLLSFDRRVVRHRSPRPAVLQPLDCEHRALSGRPEAPGRGHHRRPEPEAGWARFHWESTTRSSTRTPAHRRACSGPRLRWPAFGFVLAWLLPELKLRETVAATDAGPDQPRDPPAPLQAFTGLNATPTAMAEVAGSMGRAGDLCARRPLRDGSRERPQGSPVRRWAGCVLTALVARSRSVT